ncbi:unnamed protein product [Protopolystoma xenopodis]|uniref:Uncharacterized protein n=1 Tax=Protopolystoma xenopodis TaxID=117903 RepID=A0A448XIH8_9PLAT|nr:unnamed protein product [Protopolystoma xenopodis]
MSVKASQNQFCVQSHTRVEACFFGRPPPDSNRITERKRLLAAHGTPGPMAQSSWLAGLTYRQPCRSPG